MRNERVRLTILIVLFSITAIGVRAATHYRMAQKHLPEWSAFPYQFSGWTGRDVTFDPVYGTDPADTSLLRIYSQGHNPPVIAYIGFYADLATILEVHTPELCYPAQGWSILSVRKLIVGTYRNKRIPSSEILVEKAGDRRLVTWWYNAGARPFETRIRYIYAMLALSTFTGRTDGSMVRLETPVGSDGEAVAQTRIDEFRKSFLPELDQTLPR